MPGPDTPSSRRRAPSPSRRKGPGQTAALGERLAGKRVCVCLGAGGVGKTTVSAAVALGLAARGRRALVVSIDPARRLAGALGLEQLPGEPHRVDPQSLELEGELWAMVLDPKATLDALVRRLAADERAREEVLSNRIYRELSSATAGSQELTAVAELFDLEREDRFDAIVLDTPPLRNALDFLDAPDRLMSFLDGRALRVLSRPSGLAGGLLNRGGELVLSVLARATGVDVLGETAQLFRSLAGVLDGFSERARGAEQLLRDRRTAALIISSPELEPASEAIYLHSHLREAGISFGGLVVNRVHDAGLSGWRPGGSCENGKTSHGTRQAAGTREKQLADPRGLGPELARELLYEHLEAGLAGRVADNLADFWVLVERDRERTAMLMDALGEPDPLLVPQLDGEIQDFEGLWLVVEHLFGALA
jgi:anion-transporting  ArsA/GET3 family ATPase